MKSGDYSDLHRDAYSRERFVQITDRSFVQRTFVTHAALVAKDPVNGPRMWTEHYGQPFDSSAFDLVEGKWDHEHCSICFFTITEGHTCWENTDAVHILCDACHEEMEKVPPAVKPE
jgi:hypothetical protein